MFDEEGCLCAPAGMLEDYKRYSMKAITHQSGSIDRSLMLGKNYEVFTIPHYATGIHITEKGLDYLENYVREVREVIGYEIPLAVDHLGHIAPEDVIRAARRLEPYGLAWMGMLPRGSIRSNTRGSRAVRRSRSARARISILPKILSRSWRRAAYRWSIPTF